jgi:hypothetical protein
MITRAVQIRVTKIPTDLEQALKRQLNLTPYSNSVNNWLAVAKMETAGFTSRIYTSYNNPWNMRPAQIRQNSQDGVMTTGGNGQFATYSDLDRACEDILLYMKARKYPTSEMSLYDFVSFMGVKGYFGEESIQSYYGKVKAWLER